MIPLANIQLHHASHVTAHGSDWPELWQTLQQSVQAAPCDFAHAGYPAPSHAFAVAEPATASLGVDRKLARTMEKQAKMALQGARATLELTQWPEVNHQQTGLYLALPTIDEEVPSWSALEEIQQAGAKANLGEIFMRETPPFSGLSLLNSSACAHISATFGLMGAMAAFSPSADAGLQALIEGVLSVAEGENPQALIGGISPKLHPLLPLHYAAQGWQPPANETEHTGQWFPGEGSCFLMASPGQGGVAMTGYGRGFSHAGDHAEWQRVIQQALTMSGLAPQDIGWILPANTWQPEQRAAQQQALSQLFGCKPETLPQANSAAQVGFLGAAHPLFDVGLALHGLSMGQRLRWSDSQTAHKAESLTSPSALILAMGPHGQQLAVILQTGARS